MPGPAPTSLWDATAPERRVGGARLDGDADVDVAVVGGGYTGLWTALALRAADPSIRVLVVERHHVGFGASGRNGGWCSALLPVGLTALARRHGRDAAIAWQRAMIATVGEVGTFAASAAAAGGDPQFERGGTLTVARNEVQRTRLEAAVAEARRFGFGADDLCWLPPGDVEPLLRASAVLGATFTPHCAALHPLRLVRALADSATRAGVRIAEGVDVVDIEPGRLTTTAGAVRAEIVVLATEAFTPQLPGRRREVLPIYSLMIGSVPLDDARWEQIGLGGRQTFTVGSHLVVYGQRTADGRIAFGGRGAPYHYGSRVEPRFDTDDAVRAHLRRTLTELLPTIADVDFPFHWGGPLAVPRDWHPRVLLHRSTGIAAAGGYVGDGVAAANLAGRTLADLITGSESELTTLPWVGHRWRRWEPEPLRWLGTRLVAAAAAGADRAEASTGRLARARGRAWTRVMGALAAR
jgi:glycine/D-amino acid oxidase-like deaminating enzyme